MVLINGTHYDGDFAVRIDNQILTFTNTKEIPDDFEHLIKFAPICPPPPHTDEDHEHLGKMHDKFKELMEIEKNHASGH